jgi:hypothetical protein
VPAASSRSGAQRCARKQTAPARSRWRRAPREAPQKMTGMRRATPPPALRLRRWRSCCTPRIARSCCWCSSLPCDRRALLLRQGVARMRSRQHSERLRWTAQQGLPRGSQQGNFARCRTAERRRPGHAAVKQARPSAPATVPCLLLRAALESALSAAPLLLASKPQPVEHKPSTGATKHLADATSVSSAAVTPSFGLGVRHASSTELGVSPAWTFSVGDLSAPLVGTSPGTASSSPDRRTRRLRTLHLVSGADDREIGTIAQAALDIETGTETRSAGFGP